MIGTGGFLIASCILSIREGPCRLGLGLLYVFGSIHSGNGSISFGSPQKFLFISLPFYILAVRVLLCCYYLKCVEPQLSTLIDFHNDSAQFPVLLLHYLATLLA